MSKTKWTRRRFDTRLSARQIFRLLDLTPRQKITMMRYYKSKLGGGEQEKEES